MKLYFVRHGESEANILHEFSNRGTKHPLTPCGIEQAATLGKELKHIGITKIYTSPVLRAFQTAEIISRILEIKSFEVAFDLREYDVGILEGRSDQVSWDLFTTVEDSWLHQTNYKNKIEQGESFEEIQERFRRFITKLRDDISNRNTNVLIISHAGLLKVGLPSVVKNISFEFTLRNPIENCQLIKVVEEHNELRCLNWVETKST